MIEVPIFTVVGLLLSVVALLIACNLKTKKINLLRYKLVDLNASYEKRMESYYQKYESSEKKYSDLIENLTCEHEGCTNLKYYTTPLKMDKLESGIVKGYLGDLCSVHLVEKHLENS